MYTVKSNKEFFEQFSLQATRIKELSCMFQNSSIEVSDIEISEWNTIATKLQNDLSKLIQEANSRFKLLK